MPAAVRFVHEAPFRERRWGLLALAQYQDGRQRDALDTLHRARAVMVNELGLDPGSDLVALEQAILRQDPSLAVSAALSAPNPVCPYLGLMSYDIRDAGAYFGRDADTAACLERLDATRSSGHRWTIRMRQVVVGTGRRRSGARARRPHGSRWWYPVRARSTPSPLAPGRSPQPCLWSTSARRLFGSEVTESRACRLLRSPCRPFVETGRLVLTFRADRLGDISAYPTFAHLVERGLYLLGPMQS